MDNVFEAKFSERSVANLRRLLGETVYRIYSPMLEVRGVGVVTGDGFSLEVERKGYVAIDNLRLESENDGIDYYQLSAESLAYPKYYTAVEIRGGVTYYTAPISSVALFPPESPGPSPIVQISIYEEEDYLLEGSRDIVRYDKAAVFRCENGKTFCISASEIPSWLEFTDSGDRIGKITKDCSSRLELM